MALTRRFRYGLFAFVLYSALCIAGGIYLADATLHPGSRELADSGLAVTRRSMQRWISEAEDVSITASDGAALRAWSIHPQRANGDAVLLLHGLGDNRMGMTGYAAVLLANGFSVLLPDSRAHGASGGAIATFGLLERNDIREWVEFLEAKGHPRCVFGLGESMGAAQLLQSLDAGAHFCAVVAESPFASFREIAYDRMGQPFHLGPWVGRTLLRPLVEVAFLRARWKYGLNMEQISPEESVARANIPVLLIHGVVDSNIPVRHSRLIFINVHSRDAKTQLWEVPGADHCGAFSAAPLEFQRRVLRWFGVGSPQGELRSKIVPRANPEMGNRN